MNECIDCIKTTGNINIKNTGLLVGDCVTGNKTVVNVFFMETEILKKLGEAVEALNNLSKTQVVLSEAILKQRENDNQQSEALVILARATENNSLANLRLSESLLKDKELMRELINVLDKYK